MHITLALSDVVERKITIILTRHNFRVNDLFPLKNTIGPFLDNRKVWYMLLSGPFVACVRVRDPSRRGVFKHARNGRLRLPLIRLLLHYFKSWRPLAIWSLYG